MKNKKWYVLLSLALIFIFLGIFKYEHQNTPKYKIGICIVATGKYIQFAKPLLKSAQKYFCPKQEVHYFVFSDGEVPKMKNVTAIFQKKLGWPNDTLKRFNMYAQNKELLKSMDYIFALDADMRFVDYVGEEILSDRTATLHRSFIKKRGTYETNPISTACISEKEGKHYYYGAFYGGKTEEFFKLLDTIIANVDKDAEKNYIALWHDESHLNRYFLDNPPTKTLSPSYSYPQGDKIPYKPKVLILKKNQDEIRK